MQEYEGRQDGLVYRSARFMPGTGGVSTFSSAAMTSRWASSHMIDMYQRPGSTMENKCLYATACPVNSLQRCACVRLKLWRHACMHACQ